MSNNFYDELAKKEFRTLYKGIYDKEDGMLKILRSFKMAKDGADRFLDLGCGTGFSTDIVRKVKSFKKVYGVDVSAEAVKIAKSKGIEAYQVNLDTQRLPFDDEWFDAILASEVIEHLLIPDHLLDEVYRVLRKSGIFVIKTPNLSSWVNRIVLLLGYQPLATEVSFLHNVGKPRGSAGELVGHIRVFTHRALKELLQLHKFVVVSELGVKMPTAWHLPLPTKIIDSIIHRWSSLAYDVIFVCRKSTSS